MICKFTVVLCKKVSPNFMHILLFYSQLLLTIFVSLMHNSAGNV